MDVGGAQSWHVGLAGLGMVAGVVALLVAARRGGPAGPVRIAATAWAVLAVTVVGHGSWLAAAGVGAIAAADVLLGRASEPSGHGAEPSPATLGWQVAALAGGLLVVLAVPAHPGSFRIVLGLIVASALVVRLAAPQTGLALTPPGSTALLVLAALTTWLAAPDTEAIAVVGAALAVVLLGQVALRLVDRAPFDPGVAALVAILWAGVIGFRGRVDGAPLALVAAAAVLGRPLASLAVSRRRPGAGAIALGPWATWRVLVVLGAVLAVTARTLGIATDPPPWSFAAVATAILIGWVAEALTQPDRQGSPTSSTTP